MRLLNSNNLIGLSRLSGEERNRNSLDELEVPIVIHQKTVLIGDNYHLEKHHLNAFGSIQILAIHASPEIMFEFPLVDLEALLIGFISNAIFAIFSNHHLRALHVVVHHVFHLGHVVRLAEPIEVNVLQGCDLEAIRVFYVID